MRFTPLLVALPLIFAACSGSEASIDAVDTTAPATTEAPTTQAPTTEAPTTEAPATTEAADSILDDATQDSLADILSEADLDEMEALLATEAGRAAFIDGVVEVAPSMSRDDAGCLLDNLDLSLFVALQGDPTSLTLDQLTPLIDVLSTCNIPLTAFTG